MELTLWLIAAYAMICVAVYFGNRLYMYFPDPTRTAPAAAGLDGIEEQSTAESCWKRRHHDSRCGTEHIFGCHLGLLLTDKYTNEGNITRRHRSGSHFATASTDEVIPVEMGGGSSRRQ